MIAERIKQAREFGLPFMVRGAVWKHFEGKSQKVRAKLRTQSDFPSSVPLLGRQFKLHPSRLGLSEALVLHGVHEPISSNLYAQMLRPGQTVMDIGTNIGYFPLIAANRVGRSGRIIGCEPSPDVYEIIQKNISQWGAENITVYPYAVADYIGKTAFYPSEVPNWGSLFAREDLKPKTKIDVEVRTVDSLAQSVEGKIDVLRMDVEGGEIAVLKGASEVLRTMKPELFIEFHTFAVGWPVIASTLENLAQLGYGDCHLIDRAWDEAWIPAVLRNRRVWKTNLRNIIERWSGNEHPLSAFTLLTIPSN